MDRDGRFGRHTFLGSHSSPSTTRLRNAWAGLQNDARFARPLTTPLTTPITPAHPENPATDTHLPAPRHGSISGNCPEEGTTLPCQQTGHLRDGADTGQTAKPGEPVVHKHGKRLRNGEEVLKPAGGSGQGQKVYENNTIPPSQRMAQFLDDWSVPARHAMMAREQGPTSPGSCETCGCKLLVADPKHHWREWAYRCFDCFHPTVECRECMVSCHRRNPFHRVERWHADRGFWERQSLGQLGLTINLGHDRGLPCPLNSGSRKMAITHGHGVDTYPVRFCLCPQPGTLRKTAEPLQLILCGLWPGSWTQPLSAYTLSGLRDYHLLSMQSHMSAHDYFAYLRRSTDNVSPEDVPDRYRQFLTAAREFSFMRSTKRAGVLPSRSMPAGSLAVLCPACPQPEINLDPRWNGGRPKGEEYLDALFHTTDGNFKQNQKMKPLDPEDFPLTLGAAYFANEDEFAIFQRDRESDRKESTTCHKFGAMGYGPYGGRVSGTVSLSCARHMFVLPTGSVDLTVGEAYAYVDWIQLCGLQRWMKLRLHVAGYDINCQYRINFATRMQSIREQFSFLPSLRYTHFPPTLIAVGKFHLAAHIPRCRYKFSYNFLPGVGMTDGEGQERIWAETDDLASRTKEMTSGHRHDTHNDAYNDLNARKTHSMPQDLAAKYSRAVTQSGLAKAHLEAVTNTMPKKEVKAMKATEKEWLEAVVDMSNHKTLKNPYELTAERGLTTKELLAQVQKTRTREGKDGVGILDAVYEGVQLQALREDLLDAIEEDDGTDDSQAHLLKSKQEFLVRAAAWGDNYNKYIQPCLEDAAQAVIDRLAEDPSSKPLHSAFPLREVPQPRLEVTGRIARAELGLPPLRKADKKSDLWHEVYAVDIPLPSSFDSRLLQEECVSAVRSWEKTVRESQANDALTDVRTHIVTSEMLKLKKLDANRKAITTRMGAHIRRKHSEVVAAADEYRRARVALLALGMDEGDPLFRPLLKRDLTKFTMSSGHQILGESSKTVSWIWEDFSFVEAQGDDRYGEFMKEVRRVHWFRTSALAQRWAEELKLVTEEMFRTVRFFRHFRIMWLHSASTYETCGSLGDAAYARKQAHRYLRLLEKCKKHFSGTSVGITEAMWTWALGVN